MNLEQLSAVQSPFWILICVLLGAIAALLLYVKSNHLEDAPKWVQVASPIARGTVVTLISLLLLQFFLQKRVNTTQKPSFAVLIDNSASIKNHFKYQNKESLLSSIDDVQKSLSDKFDVSTYSFGNKTLIQNDSFGFEDKVTNLNDVFTEMYENEDPQLLKGVLLLSDGIINQGTSPTYMVEKSLVPVHTVLLGDTTVKKDIAIAKTFYNKIAYKGDRVSLLVDVVGRNMLPQNATLKVVNGAGITIQQKNLTLTKGDYFASEEFILPIEKEGVETYKVVVSSIAGEVTEKNNSKTIFIEVLDARKNVVILANSPHPDLGAIRSKIEQNKNYEATIGFGKTFQWPKKKVDLLILHQLPSVSNAISSILVQADKNKTPVWYIVGSQSNMNAFNSLQDVIQYKGNGKQLNDVLPIVNSNFSLFSVDSLNSSQNGVSPMFSPFGEWKEGGEAEVLLSQRIKKINTKYPLLAFSKSTPRTAVLAAEGFWKWRLSEDLLENEDYVSAIVQKTVQYLTVQEDTRRFQTSQQKTLFNENERVAIDALLYNASYEPTNEPEVNLELKVGAGDVFKYTFSRTSSAYNLNLGTLEPGNYSYTAKTTLGDEEMTSSGRFIVNELKLEEINLTANSQLMGSLAQLSGGNRISIDSLNSFAQNIAISNTGKPIVFSEVEAKNILSLPWILGLLLLILCVEWILRRYYGSY